MNDSTGNRPEWAGTWAANWFAWPLLTMDWMMQGVGMPAAAAAKPPWMTPNQVRAELATMELRDFSVTADGVPTLLCTPFAVHGSTIVDLAPGHSLVEALMRHGCRRLFATDWRSATADMRLLTIDSYLADLNVAVDEVGAPVDLIGLCQGGWLALLYAARFPRKVRKLVLAGAPVDVTAAPSRIATAVAQLPLFFFEDLVRQGDGRVPGRRMLEFWPSPHAEPEVIDVLQLQQCDYAGKADLLRRFREWDAFTVDLPGPFYHQVVLWLFKENRLAEGRFTALGRPVDLAEVRHPLFLVAAHDDVVVPPPQMLALRRLIGTREEDLASAMEPGGHLSMFLGGDFLRSAWPRVARWLDA